MKQLRQRPMLAVYLTLLILVTAGTLAIADTWLHSRSDDRLAVIANFLSLGTLALALVAGIIALAAYIAATGQPDLKATVLLGRQDIQIFKAGIDENNYIRASYQMRSLTLQISLWNSSAYTARSPAVIVQFQGMYINSEEFAQAPGWTAFPLNYNEQRIMSLQWDGLDYPVHGESFRSLPELNLGGLKAGDGASFSGDYAPSPDGKIGTITIRLLADGYSRRPIMQPIIIDDPSNRAVYKKGTDFWL